MHLKLQLTQLIGKIFTVTCSGITFPLSSLETEFRLIIGIGSEKQQTTTVGRQRLFYEQKTALLLASLHQSSPIILIIDLIEPKPSLK